MKLEIGKYYRSSDGRKVGPMRNNDGNRTNPWTTPDLHYYNNEGKRCYTADAPETDLIAEWEDETTMDKITMDGKYAYRKDPFTQVRILCVDRPGMNSSPVLTMDGEGNFKFHTPTGANPYQPNYDLVPFQVKLPDLWLLQYEDGSVWSSTNKELLDGVKATSEYKPRGPYLYTPKTP